VLHHDERPPLVTAGVDDLDDVRMAQADQRPRLAGEPFEKLRALRRAPGGHGELDDDVCAQVVVAGEVDLAHVPLADPTEQGVSPVETHAGQLVGVGHRLPGHAKAAVPRRGAGSRPAVPALPDRVRPEPYHGAPEGRAVMKNP
jgi:hypothetical protein